MARGGCGRRKVRPNLAADREGTRLLNLTVLRRLDPAVADILITAAHVTAYSFDPRAIQWSRKGVEGSLFVVKRKTQPRFQFIIMNRQNIENLVEDLLGNFEYEVHVPYIMYRNAADEILGIWFYDPEECEEVARLFSRIHNAYLRAPPKEIVSATKSFSDFDVEVASSVPSAEDTLEQETSSPMVPNDVGYDLLSALLTAAACVGAPAGGTDPVQPNQSIRAVPSSRHASPSAISSQPSRTSSGTVVSPDAHASTSAPTNQPANLTKQLLFPHIPIPFSQPTTADAVFASSAPPPLHPPFAIQRQQSAPLHQPFPLSSAPPPLHPQRQQSAPLHQLFSSAPPPLHPQHRLSEPFPQSTAPSPLHPQHRQSEPFPQPTATPPLNPQHRQSDPLLQPFPLSSAPPPLNPERQQSAPLHQPFPLSSAPPPLHPQRQQSAPLHQLFSSAPPPLHPQNRLSEPFPQSTAPSPLHPQHRESEPFPQPTATPPLHPQHRQSDAFPQPTATPLLHPQHRQSDPLLQLFPQSSAPPQHRQSGPLLQPFPQSTAPPPLHPQHRQSDPLLQPFPQSTAPPPPYGAPLLQPFPPPNPPSPLLAPRPSHSPVISRDRVKGALLKLVQNEDFIDMVYWEIVEGQR